MARQSLSENTSFDDSQSLESEYSSDDDMPSLELGYPSDDRLNETEMRRATGNDTYYARYDLGRASLVELISMPGWTQEDALISTRSSVNLTEVVNVQDMRADVLHLRREFPSGSNDEQGLPHFRFFLQNNSVPLIAACDANPNLPPASIEFQRISGKEGHVQNSICGMRANFSARSGMGLRFDFDDDYINSQIEERESAFPSPLDHLVLSQRFTGGLVSHPTPTIEDLYPTSEQMFPSLYFPSVRVVRITSNTPSLLLEPRQPHPRTSLSIVRRETRNRQKQRRRNTIPRKGGRKNFHCQHQPRVHKRKYERKR
uniref:Uncharacterized protein n=1 Tax=Marseillevirus LCMAC101 TaxID=2506602 RepID=A0A481YSF0_9VIRU|nr:MAG: hypothetical protein LCMAC101_02700 [Marseillevirus LCMAC101]